MAAAPDMKPPAIVAKAAAKGIKLREKFGRGGTEVGLRRAYQLSARDTVTAKDVMAISSYFKRHKVDQDAAAHDWADDSDPSAGYIAWLLWGGDAGERWADRLKARLDKDEAERA